MPDNPQTTSDEEEYKMETIDGPIVLRHGLYLTWGPARDGRMFAIATDGSPQRGHKEVVVLSLAPAETLKQAQEWFKTVSEERPWEARH